MNRRLLSEVQPVGRRAPEHGLHALKATDKTDLVRDVRPMPIKVLTVGKGNSDGAKRLAAEWADKVNSK